MSENTFQPMHPHMDNFTSDKQVGIDYVIIRGKVNDINNKLAEQGLIIGTLQLSISELHNSISELIVINQNLNIGIKFIKAIGSMIKYLGGLAVAIGALWVLYQALKDNSPNRFHF
jgi:hypothetical protein